MTMAKPTPMTLAELYDFAKKYGFEDARICFPSGTNVNTVVEDARLEIRARCDEDDESPKRIYLLG